jgi:zinc protease
MPLMLHNSRYLEREPIGTENSIRTVTLESARRFYQDWYRPDLISIIAVGDFNPTDMETQIEAAFADLKGPATPRTRTAWSVPDHAETLIGVVADPEITHSTVAIQVKVDAMEGQDLRHYRDSVLVSNLFFLMMNERLAVIAQSPGAPFLGASISQEQLNANRGLVSLGALVPEGNVEGGLEALLVELERARRHGFTLAELDRAKAIFNRNMQNYYNERRNTDSGTHADELERHVTTGEPVPGIPYEFALANALIPQVGLPEVQQFIDRALPERSRTILVGVPAKAGLTPPSEAALRAIVAEIKDKPIAPPAEEAAAGPLVKDPPKPGKIVAERKISELGVTEWQLENGLRVWLKPTGFKRDQVLFSADFSRGHDAIDPTLSVPAETAVELVGRSGLGEHDTVALGRLLAGSEVGIRPWISDTRHGLTGGSSGSAEDLDRLFQLAYLHFAAPRFSTDGLELVRENRKSNLVNRRASPDGRFYETWGSMVGPKDPRRDPWEVETLSRLDAKASEAVWRQLFGITEGGQIVLVGNFQPEQVRPLVETWLASLPKGAMIPAAYPFGPPQGGQRLSQITAGNAPTARVQYRIEGTYDGSRTEAHALRSLGGALDIQLREAVREEKGGTYGVAVDMDLMELDQPRWALTIAFDCDPERVTELEEAMVATLEDARQGKIPKDVLDRIRARQTDEWQVGRTSNGWWRDALVLGARKSEPPAQILGGLELINNFDLPKLHATAAKVLGSTDHARLIMLPENPSTTTPSREGQPGTAP